MIYLPKVKGGSKTILNSSYNDPLSLRPAVSVYLHKNKQAIHNSSLSGTVLEWKSAGWWTEDQLELSSSVVASLWEKT